MAIGGSLGLALGFLNGLSSWANRLLDSSVQMVRNVPHLALIPLAILWFGIGEEAKQFLIVLGVLFPLYINTVHGIRSVDPKLIEMGRVYGLGRWGLFRHVVLPGALPSILVGLRYALGVMWLTLIVAETIASDDGIGFMTMNARDFMQTDVVLLGIVLYALLGKLADTLARLLERSLLRWNPVVPRRLISFRHERSPCRTADGRFLPRRRRRPWRGRRFCGRAIFPNNLTGGRFSPGSISIWGREKSSPSSGAAAAAKPRCCACWPAWSESRGEPRSGRPAPDGFEPRRAPDVPGRLPAAVEDGAPECRPRRAGA